MIYFGDANMSLNIHQKISLAFIMTIFIFSMYDVLFHLLLETLHILFESTEYLLDLFIEHLFETGDRATQIIVFYILFSIICYGLYRLYRLLPIWRSKLKQKLQRQKNETFAQWHALSVLWKMAWWSVSITMMSCWLFL
jgi:hypothetical protein